MVLVLGIDNNLMDVQSDVEVEYCRIREEEAQRTAELGFPAELVFLVRLGLGFPGLILITIS